MTLEEAIVNLKGLLESNYVDSFDDAENEALGMAIKALEQEPCNTGTCKVVKAYMNEWDKPNNSDAISRQVVIEVLKDKWNAFSDANDAIQESIDTIEVLPPVKPQYTDAEIQKMQEMEQAEIQKDYELGKAKTDWIPVSERLPEEGKTVIASAIYGTYPEARYTKEYGWEWAYEAGADYWVELADVAAWLPLPKPYEPQESEDEK